MVAMNISIYIEAMDLSGQFGCGILKMVGCEKDTFWSQINMLKGNHFILSSVPQKVPKLYF